MAIIKEQLQIEKLMKSLDLTETQAREVFESDREIDKGKKQVFDLPPDKIKDAQKYVKTGTKKAPPVYKFEQRDRKENPTKAAIIAEIAKILTESGENAYKEVEITNKERQIAFKIGENAFELTIVQKRPPKK